LDGPDLAEALGVSASNANTIVHRLRGTIERSLGALLVSRGVRNSGGCAELSAILDGWDGHFNVLMRKRISRHIESCQTCDEERRRLVSPVALLGAAPAFIPAPAWLRERTLSEVQLTCAASPIGDGGADAGRGTRNSLLPVTVFVVALLAALGLTFVWINLQETTTIQSPIEVSETAPPPPPPSPVAPPPPPPPTVSVKPPVPATTPPPRRTPTIEQPSAEPTPVAPPPISEPTPVEPPPPPPPPPPPWPPWPEWPQWQWPDPQGPRPGGGDLTGPGDLVLPGQGGPNGSRPCSAIQCPP
jgi:hypothetical protein